MFIMVVLKTNNRSHILGGKQPDNYGLFLSRCIAIGIEHRRVRDGLTVSPMMLSTLTLIPFSYSHFPSLLFLLSISIFPYSFPIFIILLSYFYSHSHSYHHHITMFPSHHIHPLFHF